MQGREEWCDVEDFPDYKVSNYGRVCYWPRQHIKAQSVNQNGIAHIILSRGHVTSRRSVALLVAKSFVPRPYEHFDTPMHLDGNRRNCEEDNLVWRPRWFAVKYHKQFHPAYRSALNKEIQDVDSGELFENSMAAATKYGLLDNEILLSILNRTIVFPTNQMFQETDW